MSLEITAIIALQTPAVVSVFPALLLRDALLLIRRLLKLTELVRPLQHHKRYAALVRIGEVPDIRRAAHLSALLVGHFFMPTASKHKVSREEERRRLHDAVDNIVNGPVNDVDGWISSADG
jgi:hypothetical protein